MQLLLFEKATDGYSLTSIRGELAHGGVTLMDRNHERLVRSRLHEIEEISKEFLARMANGEAIGRVHVSVGGQGGFQYEIS